MHRERRDGLLAGLTRNVAFLALASLFADASTEMLYPVLPIFLTQMLGAGGSIVGLVEGCATATQNIVQGAAGSLSDRLQQRKPIAILGYALAAICKPLIGLATVWPGVLGARLGDRIGAGMRSAPRDALISASADAAHRGRAFGIEGAADNAGAFIGPLLAVVLLSFWHLNLRAIFYLALIPGLLAVLMVLVVREKQAEAKSKVRIDVGLRRFPKGYRAYLVATAIFGIGNSSNAFLILQARDMGASLNATILVYAVFNLVAALVSWPAGALSDRFGRRNLMLLALLIFGGSYLGLALTRNLVAVGALFILYGAFQGMFRSVGKALAGDLSPEPLKAGGIGWYSATVGLSGLVASVIAGQLWDRVGHASVFLFGAGFAALGALSLIALVGADSTPPHGAGNRGL